MSSLIFEKSIPGRKGYTLPKPEVEVKITDCIDNKYLRKSELNFPEVSELDVMRHFVELST